MSVTYLLGFALWKVQITEFMNTLNIDFTTHLSELKIWLFHDLIHWKYSIKFNTLKQLCDQYSKRIFKKASYLFFLLKFRFENFTKIFLKLKG